MKYFFDNDIPHKIPEILSVLEVEAVALRAELPPSTPDVEVFKHLGGRDIVFVTADRKQLSRSLELQALRDHSITALFLGPFFHKMNLWKKAEWFVKHWQSIDGFASGVTKGTFAELRQSGKADPFSI